MENIEYKGSNVTGSCNYLDFKNNGGVSLGTGSVIVEMKTLEKSLGEYFLPVKALIEKLSRYNEELKEENERLKGVTLKSLPPPILEDGVVIVKTTKDLLRKGLSDSKYRSLYFQAESNNDSVLRSKLFAYLNNLKDFGNKDTPLVDKEEYYFSSASENIEKRLDMYIKEAIKSCSPNVIYWMNKNL